MADPLRTFIGSTLAVGAILTGVLVVRSTRFAPEWLRPPEPATASSAGPVLPAAPVLPSVVLPSATVALAPPAIPAPSAPVASASAAPEESASAAPAVASARAGKARKPGAVAAARPGPGEPEVVELPPDFRYSPQGAGNLTFPVSPSSSSTDAPGLK